MLASCEDGLLMKDTVSSTALLHLPSRAGLFAYRRRPTVSFSHRVPQVSWSVVGQSGWDVILLLYYCYSIKHWQTRDAHAMKLHAYCAAVASSRRAGGHESLSRGPRM